MLAKIKMVFRGYCKLVLTKVEVLLIVFFLLVLLHFLQLPHLPQQRHQWFRSLLLLTEIILLLLLPCLDHDLHRYIKVAHQRTM